MNINLATSTISPMAMFKDGNGSKNGLENFRNKVSIQIILWLINKNWTHNTTSINRREKRGLQKLCAPINTIKSSSKVNTKNNEDTQMVQKALNDGINPTARAFHTSPPIVRKCLNRFKTDGYLVDRSHKPHHSPNQTPNHLKEPIVMLSSKDKRVGAEQIKVLENLTMSCKTMHKIWKKAGIPSPKPSKKHVTKNNLRQVKKRYQLFHRLEN